MRVEGWLALPWRNLAIQRLPSAASYCFAPSKGPQAGLYSHLSLLHLLSFFLPFLKFRVTRQTRTWTAASPPSAPCVGVHAVAIATDWIF